MADLSRLSLAAPVTAAIARDVRPGTPVGVRIPLDPPRHLQAVIEDVTLGADPSERAYVVRVVIPNPERSAVLVGLKAEIEFSHAKKQ